MTLRIGSALMNILINKKPALATKLKMKSAVPISVILLAACATRPLPQTIDQKLPTPTHQQPPLPEPTTSQPIVLEKLPGKIAYSDGSIKVLAFSTGEVVAVTQSDRDEFDPAWSPNALHIAFRSAPGAATANQADIMAVDTLTLEVINLTNDPGANNWSPAWSPDGRQIAFSSRRTGDRYQNIYLMDSNGTNLVNLTANRSEGEYPAWSPDGRHIAFACYVRGGTAPGEIPDYDLCLMDADGANLRHITTGPAYDMYPAWSPDGRSIAFQSDRAWRERADVPIVEDESYELDIFVMSVEGGELKNLTQDPSSSDNYPAWSPDGSYIAYSSYPQAVIKIMQIDGGRQITLTSRNKGVVHGDFPAWSDP